MSKAGYLALISSTKESSIVGFPDFSSEEMLTSDEEELMPLVLVLHARVEDTLDLILARLTMLPIELFVPQSEPVETMYAVMSHRLGIQNVLISNMTTGMGFRKKIKACDRALKINTELGPLLLLKEMKMFEKINEYRDWLVHPRLPNYMEMRKRNFQTENNLEQVYAKMIEVHLALDRIFMAVAQPREIPFGAQIVILE